MCEINGSNLSLSPASAEGVRESGAQRGVASEPTVFLDQKAQGLQGCVSDTDPGDETTLGFFAVGHFTVRKKNLIHLTETNIFFMAKCPTAKNPRTD